MSGPPTFESQQSGDALRLRLLGRWTVGTPDLERGATALVAQAAQIDAPRTIIDLSDVEAVDTAGAWLIDRSRIEIAALGGDARLENARREAAILLREAHFRQFEPIADRRGFWFVDLLAELGKGIVDTLKDVLDGIVFLGRCIAALGRLVLHPRRLRATSVIYHVEKFAFRALPIIVLINLVVGGIVAQQGIFQLRRFGAATFAVDLIGILVLRELGVLLTSIMVAGRSGSAMTAELGSMKMREEIDALRVMGLDPIEVLVVPRLLALLISLPLLTFVADMSAIFGGLLVSWLYSGISPEIFAARLKDAIGFNTFMVGFIKAPFMAVMIAMISMIEGFDVEGSAESLGRKVTESVVKSIFMVIVVDGFFAIFFASINY